MKIIAASTVTFAQEAFSGIGDVVVMDPQEISASALGDAELLVLRSTTTVNPELLDNSAVRFVGTATIGTDHMDIPYLEERGIEWCSASGCNANSVAEYLVSALLCLGNRHGLTLEGMTIGIVGVGNVGTRVVDKARALGMNVLTNDPPRREQDDRDFDWVELETLLCSSDIVTLHVPLADVGPHATRHMANKSFFDQMKPGAIFVNASRGGVMAESAVASSINSGMISHAIIDTWANEPDISTDLLERVAIATPHIAGYSYEGKVMGTAMVYHEACEFLGIPESWSAEEAMVPPTVPSVTLDAEGRGDEEVLRELVRHIYDVETDDRALRGAPTEFYEQRKHYPVRREFRYTQVTLNGAKSGLSQKIRDLGFPLRAGSHLDI